MAGAIAVFCDVVAKAGSVLRVPDQTLAGVLYEA